MIGFLRSCLRNVSRGLMVAALTALVAALALAATLPSAPEWPDYLTALLAAVALALAAALWRGFTIARFRRHLGLVLDELYHGRDEIQLRRTEDEFSAVVPRFNEVLARLHEFDVLRAERVARINRTLHTVIENLPVPAGMLHVDKRALRINPAFGELFPTQERSFTMPALAAVQGNDAFVALCQEGIAGRAAASDGPIPVRLPPGGEERPFAVQVYPMRETAAGGPVAVVFLRTA